MSIQTNIANIKAKTTGKITVKAEAKQNGNLDPSSTTLDFTLTVGFFPSVTISKIDPIIDPVKSSAWANFSLKLNNTSNEKIKVSITQNSSSNYFIITPPLSFEMDQNTITTINIPVQAAKINTSTNVTKKFIFEITYTMATDETAIGPTQQIEITFSFNRFA